MDALCVKVINQKSNLLITTKDICQTQGSELTRKGTSKYLKIFYYTEKLFSIIFSLENSETVESQRSIEPDIVEAYLPYWKTPKKRGGSLLFF